MLTHKPTVTLKILLTTVAAGLLVGLALFGCGGGGSSTLTSVAFSGGGGGPPPIVTTPISAFADAGGGTVTVTSPNTLTAGAIVVITGTTNYNGTFTVLGATATSFTITAAFVANDAGGAWQPGGGLIAGCTAATVGAPGAITLPSMVTVPSRLTGVASVKLPGSEIKSAPSLSGRVKST